MGLRKKYLIDKEFQLRTTFSIVGVVIIITAVIIGIITASVVYNNNKIENINEIEDNIVHFLTSRAIGDEDQIFRDALKQISAQHSTNMETLRKIMQYNMILLGIIIAIIIFEGIFLYISLIIKTHRISGPIYVMSNYIKDIKDGKMPSPRPLRKKDELKGFYQLFSEMVDTLKEKEQK